MRKNELEFFQPQSFCVTMQIYFHKFALQLRQS